jgi:hypothetical protein
MKNRKAIPGTTVILLAGILTIVLLHVSPAGAQSAAPAVQTPVSAAPYRFHQNRPPRRATIYYDLVWGLDSLSVKTVESGEIIRFTYHIIDASKAKALNDKKAVPFLIDPEAGVKLVIPELEQVGQLRQSSTAIAGRSYWMAFSNSGRLVKRGDHVNVVIGQFHADGLVVE